MKANIWLLGAILASSTLVTTAHADNATRVAATSALGSVVGTAIGKEIGGNNGAMIGSTLAVLVVQRLQVAKIPVLKLQLGGGLGGVGGYTVGKECGGTTGGYMVLLRLPQVVQLWVVKSVGTAIYDNYQSKIQKKKSIVITDILESAFGRFLIKFRKKHLVLG